MDKLTRLSELIDNEIKQEQERREMTLHTAEWMERSEGYIDGLNYAKILLDRVSEKVKLV